MKKVILLVIFLFALHFVVDAKPIGDDLKLTDFADVEFVALRGNSHLAELSDCLSPRDVGTNREVMSYNVSALISGKHIYINEYSDKRSNLLKFSRKGEYIDSCVVDSISSQFDIIKRKPYFGMGFLATAILNKRLEVIYRLSGEFLMSNLSKARGASGIYHLTRKNLFAWRTTQATLVVYNTNNLLEERVVDSEFTYMDSLSIVKSRQKKWIISNGNENGTYTIDRYGSLKPSKEYEGVSGYDNFDIFPILDSERYAYLNFYNGSKLYKGAIYDKKRGVAHEITDGQSGSVSSSPLRLLNNQLYPLNLYNITKQRGVALQLYPTSFLRDNIESLPDNVKAMTESLTDSDSGILMIIKLK